MATVTAPDSQGAHLLGGPPFFASQHDQRRLYAPYMPKDHTPDDIDVRFDVVSGVAHKGSAAIPVGAGVHGGCVERTVTMRNDTVNDQSTIGMRPVHALLRQLADRRMRVHSLLVHWRGRTVLDLWQWPHEPELKHKLHSATKSVTGTAVAFAEAEGLLGLEDPVARFLSGRQPGITDEDLRGMRIRDLLTMRSGHGRGLSGATTRLLPSGWVDEFLREPVVEQPGRSFMYNSLASHVLSAIVQEVSGLPVDEYLRPRLFDPLGIEDFEWERDPDGVCSGGNGLSLRPRDLLSFGVLYLQDGVWQGRRVLPAGWVRLASAPHVRYAAGGEWNGREFARPSADAVADSGYGYQFWTTEDRIFNASGIFGQECMVFPDQDGVVVVTGAMGDGSYHDLPEMLRTTFREAMAGQVLDPAVEAAERDALNRWFMRAREPEPVPTLPSPTGLVGTYRFEPGEHGLRRLSVDVKDGVQDGVVLLTIEDDRGTHTIEHGLGHWIRQRSGVSVWRLHHSYQENGASILAAAAWSTPKVLRLTWHFLESPFVDRLRLCFDDDGGGVTVEHEVNVNSGATRLASARGIRS